MVIDFRFWCGMVRDWFCDLEGIVIYSWRGGDFGGEFVGVLMNIEDWEWGC